MQHPVNITKTRSFFLLYSLIILCNIYIYGKNGCFSAMNTKNIRGITLVCAHNFLSKLRTVEKPSSSARGKVPGRGEGDKADAG